MQYEVLVLVLGWALLLGAVACGSYIEAPFVITMPVMVPYIAWASSRLSALDETPWSRRRFAVTFSWLIVLAGSAVWMRSVQGQDGSDIAAIYASAALFGIVYGASLYLAGTQTRDVVHAVLSAATSAVGQVLSLAVALAFVFHPGNALNRSLDNLLGSAASLVAAWTLSGAVGGFVGGIVTAMRRRFVRVP